jgi:hypothetical protein
LTDWKSLGQKPLEDMKAQENPVEKDGQEEYFERRRKELVRVGGVETSLDDDIEQPVPTTKPLLRDSRFQRTAYSGGSEAIVLPKQVSNRWILALV